jgi:hypothetical protein
MNDAKYVGLDGHQATIRRRFGIHVTVDDLRRL